ncbi:MAG TPA: hypothetical protein VMT50_00090 [Steroidobacteraceae bacterium]|nr:hypothetical protein [Steroidobacteraceae bacterium]
MISERVCADGTRTWLLRHACLIKRSVPARFVPFIGLSSDRSQPAWQ